MDLLFIPGQIASGRVSGLAQLNPFDLVVLLTLSNTVQNAITATTPPSWAASSARRNCS